MSNERTEHTEANYDGFALTWAVGVATCVLDLVRAGTHNIGNE